MSSANLDLVRSMYAAWGRGDYSTDWAHPDIEYVQADGPDPGTWTGTRALVDGWQEFVALWEQWHIEAEECLELDGRRVLVFSRVSGRGRSSGLALVQDRAALFHIGAGKVTKYVVWWDRERALADLGLAPQGEAAG